jgi:hypothetical protein
MLSKKHRMEGAVCVTKIFWLVCRQELGYKGLQLYKKFGCSVVLHPFSGFSRFACELFYEAVHISTF